MHVLSLHMFFLYPRPLTMYIHSTSSSHYCDSESPGSVGIVKNKDSLLCFTSRKIALSKKYSYVW